MKPAELKPTAPTYTWLDGRRYRIVRTATGSYVRADGKGEVQGIGFLRVVPA